MGKEKGNFLTVSFLKENWDQCCFERGEGTAGTKQEGQGCRVWDADSVMWDGVGWDGMEWVPVLQRPALWSIRAAAMAWQDKELLTTTSVCW